MQLEYRAITTPAGFIVYYTEVDEWTQTHSGREEFCRSQKDVALFSRDLLLDLDDQDKVSVGVILPRYIKPGRRVDKK